jgi:hypothetical protein
MLRPRRSSTMRSNLRTARVRNEELRQALVAPAPDEIERCLPGLAEAAASLGWVERRLGAESAEPGLSQDLEALQKELRMVSRLIEHGAAFYQGWAKLLGSATGGYTAAGEASPLTAAGTVSVRG